MFNSNKIVVLAPHTDDGELGCGASIAKWVSQGKEIIYVAFSTCSQSLPAGMAADTLAVECRSATRALGIENVILFDFEVRKLLFHRQEILEELIRLNKKIAPDTVLLPAKDDIHQDHQVIYAEGLRAFKGASILGYELPWNNFKFSPTWFEALTEEHLQAKKEALTHYRSQAGRRYMEPSFIQSWAQVRGVQSGYAYAEAFETYRLLSK